MESRKRISYYFYYIRRNRLFMVGIAIVMVLVLAAVFAPWITPHPGDAYGEIDILAKFIPPCWEYPFGTDFLGRDIFSRVVFGTRKSLVIGFGIVFIALMIGVPLGLIAGYAGGKIDELILRISDGFLAFPALLLPIAIGGAFGSGMEINMIAICQSPGHR